jgi:hypothetical protein
MIVIFEDLSEKPQHRARFWIWQYNIQKETKQRSKRVDKRRKCKRWKCISNWRRDGHTWNERNDDKSDHEWPESWSVTCVVTQFEQERFAIWSNDCRTWSLMVRVCMIISGLTQQNDNANWFISDQWRNVISTLLVHIFSSRQTIEIHRVHEDQFVTKSLLALDLIDLQCDSSKLPILISVTTSWSESTSS